MKRILSAATLVAFVLLLIIAVVAYPMHLGEPSFYHVARARCLVAAIACGLASIISAHF